VDTVLDPELPIIDAHHHLWKKPDSVYLVPDLLQDLAGGHRIAATVYIEGGSMHASDELAGCMYRRGERPELKTLGETEFANGAASMGASGLFGDTLFCAGIVGNIDFTLDADVDAVLDRHQAFPRFKGARILASWHDDPRIRNASLLTRPHMLMEPAIRKGIAALAARDLSFEVLVFHSQFPEVLDLARALPNQRIAVTHMGGVIGVGPYDGRRDDYYKEWTALMRELAACDNVTMKIGGLVAPRGGFGFHTRPTPPRHDELAAAWRPYVETAIELFEPRRCMFESNFPVDKAVTDYRTLWNAYKLLTRQYGEAERRQMFYGTANAFYRLGLPPA
jgi:predicted TIM-barrel fold metal-dependent hydrolase